MNPHFKKILSYTTSIALLTSSLSPVYAGKDHNKVDEDLSVEARHRPALLFSEDALREKAKAHASGHTGASGFVRDIASQAYQRVSSWFGQDEDPLSALGLHPGHQHGHCQPDLSGSHGKISET